MESEVVIVTIQAHLEKERSRCRALGAPQMYLNGSMGCLQYHFGRSSRFRRVHLAHDETVTALYGRCRPLEEAMGTCSNS